MAERRTSGKLERVLSRSDYDAEYDVVVVGGGLAGVCAAIAAARLGCRVALVEQRPVLGGNSSSLIKVPIGGAGSYNPWAVETGIIHELITEDLARNPWPAVGPPHFRTSSLWDLLLYEKVKAEENIDLYLNTVALDVVMRGDEIEGVICYQIGTERWYRLKGRVFVDCTGDATIAHLAGAEYRVGRESRDEFGELLAPKEADRATMGSSLVFNAVDVGARVEFKPPPWAAKFPTEDDLAYRDHSDIEAGYWWIEVGYPYDTIRDDDKIRDELLRQLLGVWDHIKNYGDHGAATYALYWIGMVTGKRESRRVVGDYILTERDVKERRLFPDRVAYGGWFMDVHTVGGILARDKPPEPSAADPRYREYALVRPYSIPFRCLYSKNVRNLMMAGRNISVTHVALGTTRLQATCAVIGQAVGTAAYLCTKYGCSPRDVYREHIWELQQLLLKQDCYIIGVKNEDPNDLARRARVRASSSAVLEFERGDEPHELVAPRAQLFPVSEDRIDRVSLLLESRRDDEATVVLHLRSAEDVWDFESEEDLAVSEARVPPRSRSWVTFELSAKVEPRRLYWVWLEPCPGVSWMHSDREPTGTVAAWKPPCFEKTWQWVRGSYTLAIDPPSRPYGPENVVSGVARPERWPNLWVSDPRAPLPQWIELDFGEPVTFNTIYLTFDTHLNRRVSYPRFYRAPECVRDYVVYYEDERGFWRPAAIVRGNYHRRRVHRFDPVTSERLRVEVLATNGDRSARIYEIRVYME